MTAEAILTEIKALPRKEFDQVVEFIKQLRIEYGISECALMSEVALAKDWDCPEEDEAWAHL